MRGEHIPEAEEYNISSLSFKSHRPFHPERFLNFVRSKLYGVYRVKGYFWLSTRMDFVGQIGFAGKLAEISPAGKWWAAVPKSQWDVDDEDMIKDIKKNWKAPYGDRRQELVFIGTDIDKEDIQYRLEACLLTDQEYNEGPDGWNKYTDPINPWDLEEEFEEVSVEA